MSDIQLNCWILGDDPLFVFVARLARTASVSDLQKVIKDLNPHALLDFDNRQPVLLRANVNLEIDAGVLGILDFDQHEKLHPWISLAEVFTQTPQTGRLHIVVCPTESPLRSD